MPPKNKKTTEKNIKNGLAAPDTHGHTHTALSLSPGPGADKAGSRLLPQPKLTHRAAPHKPFNITTHTHGRDT